MSFRKALLATALLSSASLAVPASAAPFTAGDLVVSLVGNTDGSSPGDNQGSPIQLRELTTSGSPVQQFNLRQATAGGQYAISGEYGSSSEGLLQRSADGRSLVIAGYGVNAAAYNAGGAGVFGNAALAQTTSVPGGSYAAVPRVVANIGANGSVDTSTALYGVFNGNNPRSVATVDGSSFYVAGQGLNKTDTATQGVFLAQRGASTATQVTGATDFRDVSVQNGQLYASRDFNGAGGAQNTEIDRFAAALPTGASAPAALPGIGPSINLTAALDNGVNNSRNGSTVYLSPQQFVFASDALGNAYLYVADTGNPKNGSTNKAQLGEGGLQKWKLVGGTWVLQYDIYSGLGLVKNAVSDTTAQTTGTSGLIGLTSSVTNGVATLYATNATLSDLDQTYVYAVTDPLSQTTLGAQAGTDAFSTIFTAPAGTNVRGIAFAPVDVPEPAAAALVLAGLGMAWLIRRRGTVGRACR